MTQALAGRPLTVYGDGHQTRSLCYVSDLVDGLWRAMTTPDQRGNVLNLGNPEEHTVLEYAKIIRDLCDSPSEIVIGGDLLSQITDFLRQLGDLYGLDFVADCAHGPDKEPDLSTLECPT